MARQPELSELQLAAAYAAVVASAWTDKSADFTVSTGNYRVTLSSVDVTATLPTSPADGEPHEFFLRPGATHTLTLDAGSGKTIEKLDGTGYSQTLALTVAGSRYRVVYDLANTRWDLG